MDRSLANFRTRQDSPRQATIFDTNGVRSTTKLSGWGIYSEEGTTCTPLNEGCCNIGQYGEIIDAEIHAVREGIDWMKVHEISTQLYIWAENQGVLKALGVRGCWVKEDIRTCLEGIMALQL